MPHHQRHRGKHPQDDQLFGPQALEPLRAAVSDLCWLWSRGYAETSSLKLVGDRYKLTARQRKAVCSAACSGESLLKRSERQFDLPLQSGRGFAIDGYNLLITIESMLSGGVLIRGVDGCIRDLAGIHGTYHKVEETLPALKLIGEHLNLAGIESAEWLLDAPVSNSGQLREYMLELAAAENWDWQARLENNPDRVLAESGQVVISADSGILDRCAGWFNLTEFIICHINYEIEILNLAE